MRRSSPWTPEVVPQVAPHWLPSSLIWSSGEKKQESLTEWCEAVKKGGGEEEEGTSALSQRLPEDTGVLDGGDGVFNSPVS